MQMVAFSTSGSILLKCSMSPVSLQIRQVLLQTEDVIHSFLDALEPRCLAPDT